MKRSYLIFFLTILFVIFVLCSIGFNTQLEITNYVLEDSRVPPSLDGYKIVQISDLHNKKFGSKQQQLVSSIKSCSPDLIVLTGDSFSKDDTHFDNVRTLLEEITTIAPVYSVAGNHEYLNYPLYMELLDFYKAVGVTELCDESAYIEVEDTTLVIYGVNQEHCHVLAKNDTSSLQLPSLDTNDFGIVLYHFANQFEPLSSCTDEYFCVFSGHTHGGIIRLPFIGGIIANDKTLFPDYEGGLYKNNDTYLISSRGLGDAFIPRFNNNPEVICVTLHHINN